jgi:hypothetical protein
MIYKYIRDGFVHFGITDEVASRYVVLFLKIPVVLLPTLVAVWS